MGQINFSSGMISLGPGTPYSAESTASPSPSQIGFPTASVTSEPSFPKVEEDDPSLPTAPSSHSGSHISNLALQNSASNSPMIDPALMATEPTSYGRPLKRMRYQSGHDVSPSYDSSMPPPTSTSFPSYNGESQTTSLSISGSVSTPLTPASSNSDDGYKSYPAKSSPHAVQDSPDLRRLSVSSLLSGPPGMPDQNDRTYAPRSNPEVQDWSAQYQDVYQDTTTWGIDRGFKDLDIGKNDDMNAISGSSPVALRDHLELIIDEDGGLMPVEFGFGNDSAFANGSYYDKPVAICIPRALEPLPSKLLENPMNLLVSRTSCFYCWR